MVHFINYILLAIISTDNVVSLLSETPRTIIAVRPSPDAYNTPHSLRQASLSSVQTSKLILLPTCSVITIDTATNCTENKYEYGLTETFHVFFNLFVTSGDIYVPLIKSLLKSAGITVSHFFSVLPSTLKYLYSVEPVRMHFPALHTVIPADLKRLFVSGTYIYISRWSRNG